MVGRGIFLESQVAVFFLARVFKGLCENAIAFRSLYSECGPHSERIFSMLPFQSDINSESASIFERAKLNGKEIWRHPRLPKLPPTAVRLRCLQSNKKIMMQS